MSKTKIIAAQTHTPEYLLHKYWARKPHNILSSFISDLVPPNGIVTDPFCGSGVVVHEAQKLSRTAYGFDINPIAVLISKVLIDPPKASIFIDQITEILNETEEVINDSFSVNNNIVKYCVHSIIPKCSECGKIQKRSEAVCKGKNLYCNGCGAKLRVNLEYLVDTEILSVAYENSKTLDTSIDSRMIQKQESKQSLFPETVDSCCYSFVENRRILSFSGMTTHHLFTERNYSILNHLSNTFDTIEDELIRNAAKLLLSASVAQCSRLIANRNNLSTGGPAWSIPGFWVPAIHLETNPLIHLKARLKKFRRGLEYINNNTDHIKDIFVEKNDAVSGLKKLTGLGIHSDLIFFDPPYGDNVPYIEFSAIWNSFLHDYPDPDSDISVSDRIPKEQAWLNYNHSLNAVLSEIRNNLRPDGKLLITFNNNDIRAWKALLSSLQEAEMLCESVTYQIPAVISSKAQKSIESSYIGDIYSVYKKSNKHVNKTSLSSVSNALMKCAKYRGGIISKTLAKRTMIISWLENNISVDLLDEMDAIRNSLFEEKEGQLHLKGYHQQSPSDFEKKINTIASELLELGPCEWSVLYQKVAAAVADYGIPDPYEVKDALADHVTFDGTRCIAYIDCDQLSFF